MRIYLAGLALAAACGGEGGSSARARDSAGIRIVENAPPGETDPTWTVVDSPLVDIGGGSGAGPTEFDAIATVLRLRDGRLAVANRGSSEIRLFDAQGAHLRSVGRAGSGPGEFRSLVGMWVGPGDSVLAVDILLRRLSVFDPSGTFVRSFGLGGEAGFAVPTEGVMQFSIPQGWLEDGSILGLSQGFRLNDPRSGSYRDSLTAIRYGPDGTARDTLGHFPGQEMEQTTITFGGQSMSLPSAVPLGRSTVLAVTGNRIYVARNDAWEVEVRAAGGGLERLIRLDAPPVAVTAEDQAKHREELLEQVEAQPETRAVPPQIRDQMLDRVRSARYPATFPFIAGILTDDAGNLWVQEVVRPGTETPRYVVLDPEGKVLGLARLPARFRATALGDGQVAGIWRDPDDVEHVRVYRLAGPKPGARD